MVNDIGMLVLTIRNLKGLNQAQLAKASGVDRAYISRFETGKMVLSEAHIAQIEVALGVSFDAVLPEFRRFSAAVLATGDGGAGDGEAGDG